MKIRTMVNTRTGMVSVYDSRVIDEMPWYEELIEAADARETSEEEFSDNESPAGVERKLHWKTALKLKAAQLEQEAEQDNGV